MSRYCFVWLTFTQTLADILEGFEAAWEFFGGIFAVVIPDNMAAIVDKANPTEPRLNAAFVEYAQDRGFLVDADAGTPSQGQAPGRAHGALRAGLVLRR